MAPPEEHAPPLRVYVLTWIAALLVFGLTWGTAYIPLGVFNFWINMACSTAKMILIGLFFMELREGPPLLRIGALAGLYWLGILFVLTLADVLTRGVFRSF